ncbi:MAG: hypothetical protein LBG77_06410, partial [Dysgonamonadaceae bacterium]|nr:hypothetical protein [Dysgonamonadaceae bacterium]
MKKNRCAVLAAIFGIFSFSVWGQGVGSWKSYKAYHNAVQVVETPQAVYAVYQSSYPDSYRNSSNSVIEQNGSLLSYSFNDKRLQTYSLEDGLNDASIRFLNYSPEANALLLVYESNNVDIFLGKHNVYNLPNLMKTAINSVDIRGKLAYLSISSGISIIDLQRKEIKSTYNLDANTMATCEWNGYIWAATTDGVYKASLNLHSSKLSDKANWEKISFPEINDRAITKMTIFQDHLIVDCNTGIWSYSKAGNVRQFTANSCKQLIVCNNRLFTIYYGNSLVMYPSVDSGFRVKTLDYMIEGISASNQIQDGYWIATGKDGLVQAKIIVEEDMAETIISNLQLNSPVRNLSFNIKFAENRLLVTGGSRAANRNNILGTFMIYENGKWLNLDKNIVAQGLPGLPDLACRDLMSAAVDPLDPHHYFVSSWGEGVYEFRDTTFLNLHSYNNSSLKTIF